MKEIIRINDFSAPELDVYVRLTGAQLRSKLEPEKGVFIAESPTVIDVALKSGLEPISLLTDERLINTAVKDIIERLPAGVPVYSAEREVLLGLTGFELTRGALCAMKRPKLKSVKELCENARRVAVLEGIADSTNIGALFRCAAALGIDAVALTHTCCDPLNRRSVRVSMGSVFLVPWTWIPAVQTMHEYGFKTVAMALTDRSVALDDPILAAQQRLAIVLGNEGDGLPPETIAAADFTVKIPMAHGVDSLNVGAAAAVAFWQLRIHNF